MLRYGLILKLRPLILVATLCAIAPAGARSQGPEVQDFNFYNTDVHLVLRALSEVTGITFVEDVPVQGKVTIHIAKRTPMEEVLETILSPLGLTWRTVGKIYHIGTKAGERPAPGRPGYVQRTFMMKHIGAGEAARRLRKFLRARGIVSVDLAMNQMTVMVPPALLDEVENLIKSIDIETAKKLISVRVKVVEVKKDLSKNTETWLTYDDYPSGFGLGSTFADTLNSQLGWGTPTGVNGNQRSDEYYWLYRDAATFKVGAWGIDQILARMKIQFTEQNIRIISEPDVVVREGTEAFIKVGQKMPIPTGYDEFQRYEDVGVNLTVKPWVDQEGMVTLEVKSYLTQRTPEAGAQGVNVLDSREIETTLSLLNGDTGRLAGLIRQEESSTIKKIPILGDIPLIGILFSSRTTGLDRKEVVILISPSIIEDVPPHGRRTPGISALVAWLIPGTMNVVLDWSDDVPIDNVGVFQYRVYRDQRPITTVDHLSPLASAVSRASSSWIDETPKRRGATYYYAVIAVDGAGNRQAVSNSPAITIPKR